MMCKINAKCFFKTLFNAVKGLGFIVGMFAAVILLAFTILLAIAAVLWVVYFFVTLDPMIKVVLVVAFISGITILRLIPHN